MMRENQATVNAWQREMFPSATHEGVRKHLQEEFHEFLAAGDQPAALEEAADVVILLYAWCGQRGLDLHAAIDTKMLKNRAREWNIQPDGTGRHKR